jgi:hypothetical protein
MLGTQVWVAKETLGKMKGNLQFVLQNNQNLPSTNLYSFTYLFLSYLALNCKLYTVDSHRKVITKDELAKATGVYVLKIPHNSRSEQKVAQQRWEIGTPQVKIFIAVSFKIMLENVQCLKTFKFFIIEILSFWKWICIIGKWLQIICVYLGWFTYRFCL